ncbi:MAG: IS4 family transposase [Chthoniobacteraceae bacterium]
MARYAKKISTGDATTEHLSCGVLALCFPMADIQAILAECRCLAQRTRDLPPQVMVFFVIALSLFPEVGYQGVLRWLVNGLRWLGNAGASPSAKSSLAAARWRLGAAPLRRLHEQLARPLTEPRLRGTYWKGHHLVALDGSTLALQDTAANAEAYGRPSNQGGEGAWPLARFVALAEVGPHLVFQAALGSYQDSEITLSRQILGALAPGMLCLADRLFPGFGFWKEAAARGCALLWRAKSGLALSPVKALEDGSWLADWHPSKKDRARAGEAPQRVRVIEYRLHDPGAADTGEVYRLLTTILNPGQGRAEELAALYPQRWEIELSIKETKSILRKGRVTLRSNLRELVEQEFWGMLLAHYAVRKMMAQAALETGADPDELSYQGGIEIIKTEIAGPALPFPPADMSAAAG